MLYVTDHAVTRFIRHWRRDMGVAAAREALEALVSRSAATRRRTLPGDAWVHVALTDRGEAVHFAVRDHAVVTVLPPRAYETRGQALLECEAPVAIEALEAERARLAERVETERAREKAQAIVAAWAAGRHVRPKALRRAREVLRAA